MAVEPLASNTGPDDRVQRRRECYADAGTMILYRLACGTEDVARSASVARDETDGRDFLTGIQSKRLALVVRLDRGERVLSLMLWRPDRASEGPIPIVPVRRCLVPFTTFSIYPTESPANNGKLRPVRFSLAESGPLGFFAGSAVPGGFAIPQAPANAEVANVNPAGMPVVLATEEEREAWLTAPWADASRLVRALPDGSLTATAARRWVWRLPPRVADQA